MVPDPSPLDDAALFAALARGDEGAFEALYRRHRDTVFAQALRCTGSREDALDVLQEAFLYLLRNRQRLELRGRLTTLLYPVVRNLAANLRRKTERIDPEPPADLPAPAEGGERREDLARAMAGLPEAQREVVLLRFVDGLSLEEAAAALEVPLGTVKARLHQALKSLREDPRTRDYFAG